MTAPAQRWGRSAPTTTEGTTCWDCEHESDEHVGAHGACIAYVIQFGRETFCLCRSFVPDDGDAA